MVERLDPKWGYTEKAGDDARPLSQEEHEELERQRQRKSERLRHIVEHTQTTVDRFRSNDPTVRGSEIVVVVVNGYEQFKQISETIGFDQLRRKFHFGAPFKDGWLVSVAGAVELKDRFSAHIHFPGEEDISAQTNRWVSPHSFDPANVAPFFK